MWNWLEKPWALLAKAEYGYSFRRLTLRSATGSLRTATMQRTVPTLRLQKVEDPIHFITAADDQRRALVHGAGLDVEDALLAVAG